MAKLVTPSPEFFTSTLYDVDTSPSYATRVMQKHNRPWLLFQLDKENSIMIPNRSGAGYENYNQYIVETPEGHGHLLNSGFDIPNAIIVHGYEHKALNDWEDLNPEEHERAEELKSFAPEVREKTKSFLKNFSSFARQVNEAEHVDELPTLFTNDFRVFSNSPVQFQQQYIPAKFTDSQQKLDYPISFIDYPQSIKSDMSDEKLDTNVPFTDPNDQSAKIYTPITNVTPLQAKCVQIAESTMSPKEPVLKSWLQNNITNQYSSVHEYILGNRQNIQQQLETDQLRFQNNPADKKDSRILTELTNPEIKGHRISVDDALEP